MASFYNISCQIFSDVFQYDRVPVRFSRTIRNYLAAIYSLHWIGHGNCSFATPNIWYDLQGFPPSPPRWHIKRIIYKSYSFLFTLLIFLIGKHLHDTISMHTFHYKICYFWSPLFAITFLPDILEYPADNSKWLLWQLSADIIYFFKNIFKISKDFYPHNPFKNIMIFFEKYTAGNN